jgi:hypothetical protein
MEINRGDLLAVVSHFLRDLSELETQLAAYERLLLWSRREFGTVDAMDLLLGHARKSVALPGHLQKALDEQLDAIANHLADTLETRNHNGQCTLFSTTDTNSSRLIN